MESVPGTFPHARILCIRVVLTAENPIRIEVAIHVARPGEVIAVIIRVEQHAEHKLVHVAFARGGPALLLRLSQRRQEQPGQNRNNSNHHKKFDERESAPTGRRLGEMPE